MGFWRSIQIERWSWWPVTTLDALGWAGTISGTVLGLPQMVRLLRTGRVDGLSLTAWRAMLVVNIGWTVHGATIGQLPQVLTSALSLCSTVPILCFMARALHRQLLLVLVPALVAAAALVSVDRLLGTAAFGTAMLVPTLIAGTGQSLELVRSQRIVGVSVLFLILAVVNQALWLSWALLVPDAGTMIAATATGVIATFNLIWWLLRSLGLQPLLGAGGATGDRQVADAAPPVLHLKAKGGLSDPPQRQPVRVEDWAVPWAEDPRS
jgi:uncharacterized protein with PQ loop repeat